MPAPGYGQRREVSPRFANMICSDFSTWPHRGNFTFSICYMELTLVSIPGIVGRTQWNSVRDPWQRLWPWPPSLTQVLCSLRYTGNRRCPISSSQRPTIGPVLQMMITNPSDSRFSFHDNQFSSHYLRWAVGLCNPEPTFTKAEFTGKKSMPLTPERKKKNLTSLEPQ